MLLITLILSNSLPIAASYGYEITPSACLTVASNAANLLGTVLLLNSLYHSTVSNTYLNPLSRCFIEPIRKPFSLFDLAAFYVTPGLTTIRLALEYTMNHDYEAAVEQKILAETALQNKILQWESKESSFGEITKKNSAWLKNVHLHKWNALMKERDQKLGAAEEASPNGKCSDRQKAYTFLYDNGRHLREKATNYSFSNNKEIVRISEAVKGGITSDGEIELSTEENVSLFLTYLKEELADSTQKENSEIRKATKALEYFSVDPRGGSKTFLMGKRYLFAVSGTGALHALLSGYSLFSMLHHPYAPTFIMSAATIGGIGLLGSYALKQYVVKPISTKVATEITQFEQRIPEMAEAIIRRLSLARDENIVVLRNTVKTILQDITVELTKKDGAYDHQNGLVTQLDNILQKRSSQILTETVSRDIIPTIAEEVHKVLDRVPWVASARYTTKEQIPAKENSQNPSDKQRNVPAGHHSFAPKNMPANSSSALLSSIISFIGNLPQ